MARDPLLRDAVKSIKAKIETAAGTATPEELAYLGTAIDRIGGRATVLEVEEMGDIKIVEISEHANAIKTGMSDQLNVIRIQALAGVDAAAQTAVQHAAAIRDQAVADTTAAADVAVARIRSEAANNMQPVRVKQFLKLKLVGLV